MAEIVTGETENASAMRTWSPCRQPASARFISATCSGRSLYVLWPLCHFLCRPLSPRLPQARFARRLSVSSPFRCSESAPGGRGPTKAKSTHWWASRVLPRPRTTDRWPDVLGPGLRTRPRFRWVWGVPCLLSWVHSRSKLRTRPKSLTWYAPSKPGMSFQISACPPSSWTLTPAPVSLRRAGARRPRV